VIDAPETRGERVRTLRLMAVGDILLQTENGKEPFERINDDLNGRDILFGNLETVLSTSGQRSRKRWVASAPPESVRYLKEAGFDILNIANNHILDLGREGFVATLDMLEKNGIAYVGGSAGRQSRRGVVIERNGIKLGFLGYTTGRLQRPGDISLHSLRERDILADIDAVKSRCDFVVISLHWGTENCYYPSPQQIRVARRLIDHGATLILGHHPHVIQGLERYGDGLIVYSLGNFQFDTSLMPGRIKSSMIVTVDFDRQGIADHAVIPCTIDENALPAVAVGAEKELIRKWISNLSGMVSSGRITRNWWFEEIAGEYLAYNWESYKYRIGRHGIAPLLECGVWLITPFCLNCYAGIVRKRLRALRAGGSA